MGCIQPVLEMVLVSIGDAISALSLEGDKGVVEAGETKGRLQLALGVEQRLRLRRREPGGTSWDPESKDFPGPSRVATQGPASELDLKSSTSSSSPSSYFSEESLPAIQREQCPEETSLLKLLPKYGQHPEWTFYPRFSSNVHTYHVGKQCFFNGLFLGNRRSLAERTLDKSLGKKKHAIDPRNGIPKLNPGDNPYMSPEQSIDFHKAGATLPPVNFSLVPYEKKFDTFIPLEPLPPIPSVPFRVKERANRLKSEIKEVEELENWRPATPLLQSIYFSGSSGSLDSSR
ncbi:spermatogenesis-associated serine-rich protein 1 [Sorex araneus]|uniref:spermatogenesis-associated serine-rich protein 1 n=1 Tax=Sorex araneus TaxID=42254 RepID=UPI002433DB23|nr:spermatogenesis-associated serine-rich protein 1 [Sorex araneus]